MKKRKKYNSSAECVCKSSLSPSRITAVVSFRKVIVCALCAAIIMHRRDYGVYAVRMHFVFTRWMYAASNNLQLIHAHGHGHANTISTYVQIVQWVATVGPNGNAFSISCQHTPCSCACVYCIRQCYVADGFVYTEISKRVPRMRSFFTSLSFLPSCAIHSACDGGVFVFRFFSTFPLRTWCFDLFPVSFRLNAGSVCCVVWLCQSRDHKTCRRVEFSWNHSDLRIKFIIIRQVRKAVVNTKSSGEWDINHIHPFMIHEHWPWHDRKSISYFFPFATKTLFSKLLSHSTFVSFYTVEVLYTVRTCQLRIHKVTQCLAVVSSAASLHRYGDDNDDDTQWWRFMRQTMPCIFN